MLFSIKKKNSLTILMIAIAIFILLMPTVVGAVDVKIAVHASSLLFTLLMLIRLKSTKKIHFSIYHLIFGIFILYNVLILFFIGNKNGHIVYIFSIYAITLMYSLFSDYFKEGTTENIERRLMYMISIGALICAIYNIAYWIIEIIPMASDEKFSRGLGTNDFLAVYMLFSIISTLVLLKGNSSLRKKLLLLLCLPLIFVFVMTKSQISYIFAIILILLFLIKKKQGKTFFSCVIFGLVALTVAMFFALNGGVSGKITSDVCNFAMKNWLGSGGGFWSGEATFATIKYPSNFGVGLFFYLYCSSGFVGVLTAVVVLVRNIMLFYKLRTWESVISLYLTALIYIMPFNLNFGLLFLWIGLIAYNESRLGTSLKINISEKNARKTIYILAVLTVLSAVLLVQSGMQKTADKYFENKNYVKAADLYNAASLINPFDGESCRLYSVSKRFEKNKNYNEDEALEIVNKAIERDPMNVNNLVEKALVHYEAGNYFACVQQYREISKFAIVNDEYNLEISKVLCIIVKSSPVGSSETKRAYEEILDIATKTKNLDIRKEINDIADVVQGYTKGELEVG